MDFGRTSSALFNAKGTTLGPRIFLRNANNDKNFMTLKRSRDTIHGRREIATTVENQPSGDQQRGDPMYRY